MPIEKIFLSILYEAAIQYVYKTVSLVFFFLRGKITFYLRDNQSCCISRERGGNEEKEGNFEPHAFQFTGFFSGEILLFSPFLLESL